MAKSTGGNVQEFFFLTALQSHSLFRMSLIHFVLLQLTTEVRKTFINNWMLKAEVVVDTNG